MNKSTIIVGLDIGTTKICAVIGELSENGNLDVVGIGTSKSTGMRKGMVVNIEQTVQAIRKAVEDAEIMAGREVTSVYAGIAGSHIMSIDSDGLVYVKGGTIGQKDVDRVVDAAREYAKSDQEIIHTLPQEFIVDKQRGIVDPLGMAGMRLEVKVHIVTGAFSSVQNIRRSCNRSGLEVSDLVLESLASAKAVLSQEEREIGVALVDLGGGTTDIAIFANDTIRYTSAVPAGGQNLSQDIAFGLKTPLAAAEKIKIKYGCALQDMLMDDESIEVPSVGGRKPSRVSRRELAMICEPRMAEILTLVDDALVESNYKKVLGAGVVLTGGGSLIEGCRELADQIFYPLTARVGYPRDIGGLKDVVRSPKFSTAVGLLRYGAEVEQSGKKKYSNGGGGSRDSLWVLIKNWLKDIS